jgi:hypothetical protein
MPVDQAVQVEQVQVEQVQVEQLFRRPRAARVGEGTWTRALARAVREA